MLQEEERLLVAYRPTLSGRKWVTDATSGANGGLHSVKEFNKGIAMLEHCAHNFRNPRLFHVCLTGGSVEIYKLVLIRFCRGLAAAGVDYRYKAALENDNEKGEHLHLMIVLGAGKQQTHSFITHTDESKKLPGRGKTVSLLRKAVQHTWDECPTLDYRVNPPNRREGMTRVSFMQMNQTNQEFFDEAANWLSYIYKVRSKPASGRVYFSDQA